MTRQDWMNDASVVSRRLSGEGRALIACAAWLQLGFVGCALAAAGALLFASGGRSLFDAIALVAGGVALAVESWCRGRAVLERAQGRPHDGRSPESMRGARDRYAP